MDPKNGHPGVTVNLKKGWMQGQVLGEIKDLEFENDNNVKRCIFRTL